MGIFLLLELDQPVDLGRSLCGKSSSLPLTENGNVFMFGSLFYEEYIINWKQFTIGKETQMLVFIRMLPCLLQEAH